MDIGFAHSLLGALQGDRCIFGYSGLFPDEHSARLIELGEAVLNDQESTASVRGRLGYVMVEAYQNIVRHRAAPSELSAWGPGRSLFLCRCGRQRQQVFTFNPVSPEQAKKLDTILTELQGLDNAGLKALFMEGIQRVSAPGTRGAGLGLIEMVRRADGRPRWGFSPIDEEHELFALTLELGGTGGMEELMGDPGSLREQVLKHRVLMFYAGYWSPEVEKTLLELAGKERHVGEEERRLRSAELLEVAREVSTAAGSAAPMVFLLHGDGGSILSIGGPMERMAALRMRDRLGSVRLSFGVLRDEQQELTMVRVPW